MAVRDFWRNRFKSAAPAAVEPESHRIGRSGELRAEGYLIDRGFIPVARNYRCKAGEIDLIMREQETLVFVEVRRRKSAAFGSPLETISLAKQRKIQTAAMHFVTAQKISSHQALRFDVVGITDDGTSETIDWIRNAF